MTAGERGFHILVVDDEVDVKLIIQQKFRRQIKDGNWRFDFAHNGEEALRTLREHQDIDVVLTDINMPVMDGLSLLREMGDLHRQEMRAVVVSAYGDLRNIRKAMNLGAFDFLTKPIDLQELESTISNSLSLVQKLKEARRREAASRTDYPLEMRASVKAIILCSEMLMEEAGEMGSHLVPHLSQIKAAGEHILTLMNEPAAAGD